MPAHGFFRLVGHDFGDLRKRSSLVPKSTLTNTVIYAIFRASSVLAFDRRSISDPQKQN
jgi:hypothetical protein